MKKETVWGKAVFVGHFFNKWIQQVKKSEIWAFHGNSWVFPSVEFSQELNFPRRFHCNEKFDLDTRLNIKLLRGISIQKKPQDWHKYPTCITCRKLRSQNTFTCH
jgi:hypothetical protein